MNIVSYTAVSQIQVVSLCRIFSSQSIYLFHNRHDTYTLTVVADINDSIFHLTLVTDCTSYLEVRESLTFSLVKQFVWQL